MIRRCTAGDLVAGAFAELRSPAARPPVVQIALALLLSVTSLSAQTMRGSRIPLAQSSGLRSRQHVFELLLKANPKNADYRERYAELLYRAIQPADAQKLFDEALRHRPEKRARLPRRWPVFWRTITIPRPTIWRTKALEADPKLYQAHELMARSRSRTTTRRKPRAKPTPRWRFSPTRWMPSRSKPQSICWPTSNRPGSRRSAIAARATRRSRISS